MATSGDKTIDTYGDLIIKRALRKMRKKVRGEDYDPEIITDLREDLNAMILEWQALGPNLWIKEEVTLFLTPGQRKYLMPGYTNMCLTSELVEQTIDGAVTAPSSTIDVTSSTGIAAGDQCLIIVSTTEIHRTTVNGAPSGNTVTLTDSLSSDVADGAAVYFWTTTLADRPLRLEFAMNQYAGTGDANESWILQQTREEYKRQTNKDAQGQTVRLYYNPDRTVGELYAWPTGSDYGDRFNLDMMFAYDIFTSASDDADFPQEWMNALTWGLASEACNEFGVPAHRQQVIDQRASISLKALKDWDKSNAPIEIEVDLDDISGSDSMHMDGFNV